MQETSQLTDVTKYQGYSPKTVTHNLLIYELCKQNKVAEAENFSEKMSVRGHTLDIVTYNILIDGLCRKVKQNLTFSDFALDNPVRYHL